MLNRVPARTVLLALLLSLAADRGVGAAPPPRQVDNLGLESDTLVFGANWFAFVVSEASQGDTDLNGDGDANDNVLFVYDGPSKSITNLRFSVAGTPRTDGGVLFFLVSESKMQADLNNDGDTKDRVAHIYHHRSRKTRNLELAIVNLSFDHALVRPGVVGLLVDESDQGQDLNGDGDQTDTIVHTHRVKVPLKNGVTTNLGFHTNVMVLGKRALAFSVLEETIDTDLNGDGDADDVVVHVHHLRNGTTVNLGVAGLAGAVSGDAVLLTVIEDQQGNMDLNGDGDSADRVLHYYDGSTLHNDLLHAGIFASSGSVALMDIHEASSGDTDFNQDGDTNDLVLFSFDLATGVPNNIGHDTVAGTVAALPKIRGDLLSFWTSEFGQGDTDLNGDGDTVDAVMHVHELSSGTTWNTGLAGPFWKASSIGDRIVSFGAHEAEHGNTDMNGDGDSDDTVQVVFDASTGTASVLPLAAAESRFVAGGSHVLFKVDESDQGADLNVDGDQDDMIYHWYDASSATTTNLALAGFTPALDFIEGGIAQGFIAFTVDEATEGGADRNGDGDATDRVVHVMPVN